MAPLVSGGFGGRRAADADPAGIPPGRDVTADFPVLSAGPAPDTAPEWRDFWILGEVAGPRGWAGEESRALPSRQITRDIHGVTRGTRLGTVWRGVPAGTLPDGIQTAAGFVTRYCGGGHTASLPPGDVTGGKARVVFACAGQPLEPGHGGPARVLIPHHSLWNSATRVRGPRLRPAGEPGSWQANGHHNDAGPWREQRDPGD